MARQIALAIGVSKVPGFPTLAGIKTGIAEFSAWARGQGFDVRLFADYDGEPVRAKPIMKTVAELVKAGDVERLFIYFAGHGLAVGAWDDLWLLSEADEYPNEAINVSKSADQARQGGIPHVVLFGDACRNAPGKLQLSLTGSVIFPNAGLDQEVQVDRFFATRSGDSAFEKVPEGVAVRAFGVFTRCLMPALGGQIPEVVKPVSGGRMPRAVLAHPLRRYLLRQVRLDAYREVQVDQRPDCIAESEWEPNVLAWLKVEAPAAVAGIDAPDSVMEMHDLMHDPDGLLARLDEQQAAETTALADRFAAARGRAKFETKAGLSIIGPDVAQVMVAGGKPDTFREGGAWHVRGRHGEAAGAMLRLKSRSPELWAAAAILPGYVGTLWVSPVGVEQLEYLPAAAGAIDSTTHDLIARASAQLRIGSFEPDADPRMWAAITEDLNPTLVILAAYYLDRKGWRGRVRDLLSQFEARQRAVPFDLVLLAGADERRLRVPVAPMFPLITRGWWLADTLPVGKGTLADARRVLAPTLWTSFADLAPDLAAKLVES